MFTVKLKSKPEHTYVVYAVDRVSIRHTRFLMWDGNVWRWEDADSFAPVDDNG